MKCKQCGKKYSADLFQPAPGGSSAPGVFFILALVLFSATLILFLFELKIWMWIALGTAVFVSLQIMVAWSDCRNDGGYAKHGGVTCPECKTVNTVYPWSF